MIRNEKYGTLFTEIHLTSYVELIEYRFRNTNI